MKAIVWNDEDARGRSSHDAEIPADLDGAGGRVSRQADRAGGRAGRRRLLEAYLDGNEPDDETLRRCIRKGTVAGKFVPVLCGSAFKNKGVQPLLDAVVDFLPSPIDVPPSRASSPHANEQSSASARTTSRSPALAFKIMTDPFVGSLTFVRIYSGMLESRHLPCSTRSRTSKRARRPHAADACQPPRGHQGSARRRHRGAGRA